MSSTDALTKGFQNLSTREPSIPSSTDIESNLRLLRHLTTHFKTLKCREPTCRSPLPIPDTKSQITFYLSTIKLSPPGQISGIYCKKCQKFTCIGCRSKPTPNPKTTQITEGKINHCCSQGRLFGIWILLCRFDQVELQLREKAAENAARNMRRVKRNDGVGFHDFDAEGHSIHKDKEEEGREEKMRKEEDLTDDLIMRLLNILLAFLPSIDGEASLDRKPPPQLISILRLSLLFERLVAFLRNDSIVDMALRKPLYNAVFDFVTGIAKNPALVMLLTEERPTKKRTPGLQKLGDEGSGSTLIIDRTRSGMAASLIDCSGDTFRQAREYQKLSSGSVIGKDMQRESGKELSICGKIMDFYYGLKTTSPEATAKIWNHPRDAWKAFTEASRVTFTDSVLENHMCHKEFSAMEQSPRGRMAAIGKEIANLKTSLPSGIFVKVSERRPDVMKVLIVGVQGTVYANGLFCFDMYLPTDWPKKPPVIFGTLYEGIDRKQHFSKWPEVEFNPNLHPDGVVCLSLINTWPARHPSEKWQPGISTLLSVFVSIQAMILGVLNPEDNRLSVSKGNKLCQNRKDVLQMKTVYYAMLYWLTDERAKRGVWHDVVKAYWKYNGRRIFAEVREWGRTNVRLKHFCKQDPYADTKDAKGPKMDLVKALARELG